MDHFIFKKGLGAALNIKVFGMALNIRVSGMALHIRVSGMALNSSKKSRLRARPLKKAWLVQWLL